MLEDHADAEPLGDPGAGDPDGFAVPEYLARIGLERSEQHLDQRRLAGAVFTEQRVDLALRDVEVDVIARRQRAENLRKAANLEQVRPVMICTHSASHPVTRICSVFPLVSYARPASVGKRHPT